MKVIKYIIILTLLIALSLQFLNTIKETDVIKEKTRLVCIDNVPHRNLDSYKPKIALTFNSNFMLDSIYHIFELDGNNYSLGLNINPFFVEGEPVDSIGYKNLQVLSSFEFDQMVTYITYVYSTINKDLKASAVLDYIHNLSVDELWNTYWQCIEIYSKSIFPSVIEGLTNHVVYLLPTTQNLIVDAVRLNKVGAVSYIYMNNSVDIHLVPDEKDEYSRLTNMTMPEPISYHRRYYDKWKELLNVDDSLLLENHFNIASEAIANNRFYVAASDSFYLGSPDYNTSELEDNLLSKKIYLIVLIILFCALVSCSFFDLKSYFQKQQKIRIFEEKQKRFSEYKVAYPYAVSSLVSYKKEYGEEDFDKILSKGEDWLSQKEKEIRLEIERKQKEDDEARALAQQQKKEASAIKQNYPLGYEAWFTEIIASHREEFLQKVDFKIKDTPLFNGVAIGFDDDVLDLKTLNEIKFHLEKSVTNNDSVKELVRLIKFPDRKVIEYKDTILKYDKEITDTLSFRQWRNDQIILSTKEYFNSRNLIASYSHDIYKIPVEKYSSDIVVISSFKSFYCKDTSLDYTYFQKSKEIWESIPKLMDGSIQFNTVYLEPICRFVENLAKKYCKKSDDYITVLLNTKKQSWKSGVLYGYLKHFMDYLTEELSDKINVIENDSLFVENWDGEGNNVLNADKVIIILDYVSSKSEQIELCKKIIHYEENKAPLLMCFSIINELDAYCMKKLIDKKNAEIEEERQNKIREENAHRAILDNSKIWQSLGGQMPFYYFVDYYPYKTYKDTATSSMKDAWNLVWSFKNDPDRDIEPTSHKNAFQKVLGLTQNVLEETFSKEYLKYITLACIPASKIKVNELRYKDFSYRLCELTGMNNSFDHIIRIKDKEEKHLGGSSDPLDGIHFDEHYFQGKYVLLFDDVITRGRSMLTFKHKLESMGAIVIGGISIGRTM